MSDFGIGNLKKHPYFVRYNAVIATSWCRAVCNVMLTNTFSVSTLMPHLLQELPGVEGTDEGIVKG